MVAEYLPQTPIEQELVHRLASLFWRLRRATAIETGLLRMQAEILCAFRSSRPKAAAEQEQESDRAVPPFVAAKSDGDEGGPGDLADTQHGDFAAEPLPVSASRAVAVSFLRLANLDNDIVDRLSRHEAALWRQLQRVPIIVGHSLHV
jgi:hypothetical protein